MKSPALWICGSVLACNAFAFSTAIRAADVYPNKPVRIVLPAAVGGSKAPRVRGEADALRRRSVIDILK